MYNYHFICVVEGGVEHFQLTPPVKLRVPTFCVTASILFFPPMPPHALLGLYAPPPPAVAVV
jgi:hypothetical protein